MISIIVYLFISGNEDFLNSCLWFFVKFMIQNLGLSICVRLLLEPLDCVEL